MDAPKTPSTSTAVKAGRLFSVEKLTPTTTTNSSRLNAVSRVQGKGKLSLWDSAAVGMAAGSPERGLRTGIRGRVHAQVDMKKQAAFFDREFDRFLGNGSPKVQATITETAPEVCHSPCHFLSKYGRKPFVSPRRLEPLRTPRELSAAATASGGTQTWSRERANAEARQACWAAQLAVGAATRGLVAAAAV